MAGLVAGTFVLSYDDLRELALMGGAHRHYAALYPAMVDGLVVMTILSLLLARRARDVGAVPHRGAGGPHALRGRHRVRGSGSYLWSRFLRWSLLILLVGGAGALAVQRSVRGYQHLPHDWVSAGVAAAPWIILLIAAWLWLTMVTQARAARPVLEVDSAIVPGLSDTRPEPRPEPRLEPLALEPPRPEPTEPEEEPEPEEPAWMRRPPPPPDVKLVGRKVPLGDTDPDGIPTVDQEPEDIDDDPILDDRAEDPDGGDGEAIIFDTPPSSTFRSSPVPPGNEDTGENLLATGPNGEG
jgi:Protein of unknown function (DUF2637)